MVFRTVSFEPVYWELSSDRKLGDSKTADEYLSSALDVGVGIAGSLTLFGLLWGPNTRLGHLDC